MTIDPSDWLRSLPWSHIALTLSVGLNLVLLVIFLFRRAVNGIILNLYRTWCDHAEGRRHVLRDLYTKMDMLNHDYLFLLVTASMAHNATSDQQRQIILHQHQDIFPRLETTRTFLAQHELDLPQDVRQLVERLRIEMILPPVQSMDDASAILRHSEAVTRITRAIKTAVSGHVRGGPWPRMRIHRREGHASKV